MTGKSRWLSPPENPELQLDQVDVWRVLLTLQTDPVKLPEATLSVDEARRAARFHFDKDRNRFIVAHASLREILARYVHSQPDELNFFTGDYGKPALLSDAGVEFNLSHSGDYALIAVARARNVGVDIESIRDDIDYESLGNRYFSPHEVSELNSLPKGQRHIAFYNGWTRKEAYIKAHGKGLSLPLDSFDVSLSLNEPVTLRATRPDPLVAARWVLLALEVAPGYAGALAVEEPSNREDFELRLWNWNPTIR